MDRDAAQPEETLDLLAGSWRILQLRRGHRFTTDDLLTAWLAARVAPGARRLLDIGAGIGSVGLLTLWRMDPAATLVAVEAQEISHRLFRRTLAINGLEARVAARHGDLRDAGVLPEGAAFELVTGSPPYIPPGKGIISSNPQRAGARIELRGDVFDYCRTAARCLAPGGWFCFVHAAADPRPEVAVAAAGLALRQRIDVVFRDGRPPTIALFAATHAGPRQDGPPIVVRDAAGDYTPEYLAVRAEMGSPMLPPDRGEPSSKEQRLEPHA